MKELKRQEAIVKATIIVVVGFMLIMVGYNIALINLGEINSFSEWKDRSGFYMGAFVFSLLLNMYSLKGIRAKILAQPQ